MMNNGSAVPSMTTSILNNIFITIPPKEVLSHFDESARCIWNFSKSNNKEIKRLSQLRDTLLPKLMSGEIEIKD